MRRFIIVIVLLGALVVACSSPDVDSMTPEQKEKAMRDTLNEQPARQMTDAERVEETTAVQTIMGGTILKTAAFQGRAHDMSGAATLVQKDDGVYLVFSDDFATDAGPDLRVILAENSNPQKSADLHEGVYTDLGSLKSTTGTQVYPVPRDIAQNVGSVTVYCKPFKVIFGVGQFT